MLPTWENLISEERIDIRKAGMATLAHAMCETLAIPKLINRSVAWDDTQAKLSPGVICKAMILNILSKRSPLYLFHKSFADYDTSLLFGDGISSEDFTDDRLGWFLDRFEEANPAQIFMQISLRGLSVHQLEANVIHADTTSVSVEGAYETEGEQDFNICHGHSKDLRKDLKQIMMGLVVQQDGMPLLGNVLSGNTSDKTWNGDVIGDLADFLSSNRSRKTIYVADSALVTDKNLVTLMGSSMHFISRLPGNYGICETLKNKAWVEDQWSTLGSFATRQQATQYFGRSYEVQIEGFDLRALVVYSTSLENRKVKTLERRLEKQLAATTKAAEKLAKTGFACEKDAILAKDAFLKEYQNAVFPLTSQIEPVVTEKYTKRGKPGKNAEKVVTTEYHVVISIGSKNQTAFEDLCRKESTFILLTDLKDTDTYTDEFLLKEYKEQWRVEDRFRFLKQPVMLGPVYLKNHQRVKALGFVFLLALMVATYIEFRVRHTLKKRNETILNLADRPEQRPTFRTINGLVESIEVRITYEDDKIKRHIKRSTPQRLARVIDAAGFNPAIYIFPFQESWNVWSFS